MNVQASGRRYADCPHIKNAFTVSVIFTAIFLPKNKIHRKYVHLFRPKNRRRKNKTNAFFGAENEKENEIRPVSTFQVSGNHVLDSSWLTVTSRI